MEVKPLKEGGVYKMRKDRKRRKSRSEEKVVGFSSTALFPARKLVAVNQSGTMKSGE